MDTHNRPTVHSAMRALREAFLETAWPTRCAACDAPGELLCPACRASLPYIDRWRACPRCGAPLAFGQCTECNPVMLAAAGRDTLPFTSCASVVAMSAATGRIVTLCKDYGERRLADTMARLMADCVDPAWLRDTQCITFVPARRKAAATRGFDHAERIAEALGSIAGLPCAPLMARPSARDQRMLSRTERRKNAEGMFQVQPDAHIPRGLILVDDVMTTGATLYAACDALSAAGVETIRCLTFARTW